MIIHRDEWPVLIVSRQFNAQNDEGYRLRQMEKELKEIHGCHVIPSFTYEDGYEIFRSRADFGCIIIDWDIPETYSGMRLGPQNLVIQMRDRHEGVPILLMTGHIGSDHIPIHVLKRINGCLWKTSDTISFLAGRIEIHLNGTSNVNQIIWRNQVLRDDIAFVDRNCHKSLNYAMVITEAFPIYMIPRRNKRGIIDPVSLSEFSPESIKKKINANTLIPGKVKKHTVKMSALTNSTYAG